MTPDHWIAIIGLGITAILVPSMAWLVKQVLCLRKDMVELQTQLTERTQAWVRAFESIQDNCGQHRLANEETQKDLRRMDGNIIRLCQAGGLEYDSK